MINHIYLLNAKEFMCVCANRLGMQCTLKATYNVCLLIVLILVNNVDGNDE